MPEWIGELLTILLSWPVVSLILALVFRRPILLLLERLTRSESGKAEFGPVKIELGKLADQGKEAIEVVNRLSALMAESRQLELEITEGMFGGMFTPDQRAKMKGHIGRLDSILEELKAKIE